MLFLIDLRGINVFVSFNISQKEVSRVLYHLSWEKAPALRWFHQQGGFRKNVLSPLAWSLLLRNLLKNLLLILCQIWYKRYLCMVKGGRCYEN